MKEATVTMKKWAKELDLEFNGALSRRMQQQRSGDSPKNQPKYVGSQANELSKWLSTERIMKHKYDQRYDTNTQIRSVLRIDDGIEVEKLSKSALAFVPNPLEDLEGSERSPEEERLASPEEAEEEEPFRWPGATGDNGLDDRPNQLRGGILHGRQVAKEDLDFDTLDEIFRGHVASMCQDVRANFQTKLAALQTQRAHNFRRRSRVL